MESEPAPSRHDPDFEVDVLRYVWRAWRAQCTGEEHQLESVEVHLVGIFEHEGRAVVHVEWSNPRQVGRPRHVLRRAIRSEATEPDEIGDEVVYKLWAEANGTY